MTNSMTAVCLVNDLIACGDPRDTDLCGRRLFDYVTRLNLDRSHVPALLEIARQMAEPQEWSDDEDDLTWTPPIHAYRALAQIGAPEAVNGLLGMMDRLDEMGDDWYLNEFASALGLIGPPAFDACAAYLADRVHGMFPASAAAHGLVEIAKRHPEFRGRAVECISSRLAEFESSDMDFNGFLVGHLLDLKAVEAAEVIERAFAAQRVECCVTGNWHDVRTDLGVTGMGLMSEEEARCEYGWQFKHLPSPRIETFDGPCRAHRGFKSRDKQKRMAQKQAKRRGRRRR